MKGMAEARAFYEKLGREMIRSKFPEYEKRIAVGLVGQGSECFGFDDEISRDHDFAARFCLWITKEDDEKIGFSLMDAYQKLCAPNDGGHIFARSGVFTIEEFFYQLIGRPNLPTHWREWFLIPEHALATAVNGEVFRDDLGAFSAIRNKLLEGYPEDILLKKLAAHLALMAQSGQYNYSRSVKRGELGAAELAVNEFVDHAFHCLFLFNNQYIPYYKWRFRAAKDLPLLQDVPDYIFKLMIERNEGARKDIIYQIACCYSDELKRRGLISSSELFLEAPARELMKKIKNPEIRALHLMEYGTR